MKSSKLLLAAIGATVFLGALVGNASARNLSTSSQTLRALFREIIFNTGFGNWSCELQLEGSLHARTIAKTSGALIGYITAARILGCVINTVAILTETLPWHLRYSGFTGTLPTITSVRVNLTGMNFRIRESLFSCLATTEAAHPALVSFGAAGGVLANTELAGEEIPTTCGVGGTLGSNRETNVTSLNSTTRITVSLI